MNKCEKWSICPLGDLAKHIGCRKPHCPEVSFASAPRPFTKDIVIPVKKKSK